MAPITMLFGHLLLLGIAQAASLLSKNSGVTYIALPLDGSSGTNITFQPSVSGFGRPLNPNRKPSITLTRKIWPRTRLPPGRIGHHLLSVINDLWHDQENLAFTYTENKKDDDFPEINTRIIPSPRSRRMTPLNVAWGLVRIAHETFWYARWEALWYDWWFSDAYCGTTQTAYQPKNAFDANSTYDGAHYPVFNGSVNARVVRTVFTNSEVPPDKFLILVRELLDKCWQHSDDEPIRPTISKHIAMTIALPDGPIEWRMQIRFFMADHAGEPIVWADISYRILRMLQLPAYTDRWMTLYSEFLMGENGEDIVANLTVNKMMHGVSSNVEKGQIETE